MSGAQIATWFPADLRHFDAGDWRNELYEACGAWRFGFAGKAIFGGIRVGKLGLIPMVRVATNIEWSQRDYKEVRNDPAETLLLILQCKGRFTIEQGGNQTTIKPWDYALLDTALPSKFLFSGAFSDHICFHLPRQLLLNGPKAGLRLGGRLSARDPMALVLTSLLCKLVEQDRRSSDMTALLEIFFDAVKEAFRREDEGKPENLARDATGRLGMAQMLIDANLASPDLTSSWLAERLCVSMRTLQEDFKQIGSTPTLLIRNRRLQLAHQMLKTCQADREIPNIASVAYQCGFNDLSYFNRSFRSYFSCKPSDLLMVARIDFSSPSKS